MRAWFLVLLFMVVGYVDVFLPVPAGSTGGVLVYRIENPYGRFFHDVVLPIGVNVSSPGFYYLRWKLNYTVVDGIYYVWFPVVPPGTSYLYVVPDDGSPTGLPERVFYYTDFSSYSDWSNSGWSIAYSSGRLELSLSAADDYTHEAYFTRDMPLDTGGAGYRVVLFVEWVLPQISSSADEALAKILGDSVYYLVEDWTSSSDYSVRYRYERFYSGSEYYDVYTGVSNRFVKISIEGYNGLNVTVTDLGTGAPVAFSMGYNVPSQLRFYGKIQYGSVWGSAVNLYLYNLTIYRWAPISVSYYTSVDSVSVFSTSVGGYYYASGLPAIVYGVNSPDYQVLVVHSDVAVEDYQLNIGNLDLMGYDFRDSSNNSLYYAVLDDGVWIRVNLTTGVSTIYVYPGDNGLNSPANVFLLYDDFNGDSLDTGKWVTWDNSGATITVSNSILDIYRPAGKRVKINSTITFDIGTGVILEARQYIVQTSNYYYHTYAVGNDNTGFSSVGYVIYTNYESAVYTGDGIRPPRTGSSSSTDGDIINNPVGGAWQTIQFVIPVNDYLKHRYNDGTWQVSSRYHGISCSNAKLVMWFQAAASYAAETKIDYIRIRRYVEPEPTVSTEFHYPGFTVSAAVNYGVNVSYYLFSNGTLVETNLYSNMVVPENVSEYCFHVLVDPPSSSSSSNPYSKIYYSGDLYAVTLYNITLWGGDEFYGSSRSVRGYIETRSVDNNWVNLGSYDSVLIQYYSPGATAGFYEGGNYVVVGYLVQAGENIDILGARYIVDASGSLQNIKYVYSSVTRQYYPSNAHYAKLVFYKGNVLALINLGGNWYRVEAKHNSTSVSYLVFTGDGLPANVTIMRGDYLRFRGDNLVSVEFTGFDGLGNTVHFSVGDNSPGDVDTETGSIMVQELPYLYPLRGNLTFYYRGTGLSFNYTFPRIERGQWVNVSWGNLSLRNVGNSTLVNAVLDILRHPYGRIVLGLLPVLLMLYPNRKYGAIMGIFAVALLGFFNVVAFANGLDPIIDPRALVLSFIVLAFGLLYEVK